MTTLEYQPPAEDNSAHANALTLPVWMVRSSLLDASLHERIVRCIEANLHDAELSPEIICRKVGISRSQLYRLFVGAGGVARYIREYRLKKARTELLASMNTRISDIAYRNGFASHAHFSRAFKQYFGCTPWECALAKRVESVCATQSERDIY